MKLEETKARGTLRVNIHSLGMVLRASHMTDHSTDLQKRQLRHVRTTEQAGPLLARRRICSPGLVSTRLEDQVLSGSMS